MKPAEPRVEAEMQERSLPSNIWSVSTYIPALLYTWNVQTKEDGNLLNVILKLAV
jgi:hypothetical protein